MRSIQQRGPDPTTRTQPRQQPQPPAVAIPALEAPRLRRRTVQPVEPRRFLHLRQLRETLGVSKETLRQIRDKGLLPPPIRILGPGSHPAWRTEDIDAVLEQLAREAEAANQIPTREEAQGRQNPSRGGGDEAGRSGDAGTPREGGSVQARTGRLLDGEAGRRGTL